MYRQVITITGDDTCGIMERFVEITAEKVKLLKARQLMMAKVGEQAEDISLITNIDIQSINYRLEQFMQEERKIEGMLLSKAH